MMMTEAREMSTVTGVQVIRRVASILRALKDEQSGLSLSQLAERTQLARSTVHRLVTALQDERFLMAASPNGRVRLGPALAALAATAQQSYVADFHPYLEELALEINETVDLAVFEDGHVRFLDQVPVARRLRAVSAIGSVFPVHCTANGKALLARLSEEELVELLPRHLPRLTPNTITSRAELLAELEHVRTDGIAFDREEHTLGICAVGIAVDAPTALLAVSVPVPEPRFHGNEPPLVKALLQLGRRLEEAFATTP
jgi:DNA-binding IclR family transcriptional regulator